MSQSELVLDSAEGRILTGLVGRHIGASRSPWLHEREAAAQGLLLSYTLFDFEAMGRDESWLPTQLDLAEAQGYAGLNITYPYKQAIIAHLHELAPCAARVGAVNTVQFAAGRRIGHNTDFAGFAESMRAGLPGASMSRVLQIGAGGAGAATAHALLELGVGTLLVCDRDMDRALQLVQELQRAQPPGRAVAVEDAAAVLPGVEGLVNATPMGMVNQPQAPVDTRLLDARHWVADIVYFPLETELLRAARERGCRTLDGGGMAVYQAAAAFDIFTGRIADRPRMLRNFVEFAAERSKR